MLVERSPLMESALDKKGIEEYSKLLFCCRGPYRFIIIIPEYAKIFQDGIRNTVSNNRLTRLAKEERSKIKTTFDSRTNNDTNPPSEAVTENEKNFNAVRKIFKHKNRPTGTCHITRWYDYELQYNMVDPAAHNPQHIR